MTFINALRTARWPFVLLGGVSRLFRCPPPPEAFAAFDAANHGRPINGQGLPEVASLPYGRHPMSYNGCELIAAYDLLCLLGRPQPLGALAARFARRGMLLGGRFGTDPNALAAFFREQGFAVERFGPRRAGDYDRALTEAGLAVFSYWTGRRLRREDGRWHTLHTVAAVREGEGLALYNESARSPRPLRRYATLDAFIRDRDVQSLLLLTVRPPEHP